MKNVIEEQVKKYTEILEKYGVHVTKFAMNGPVTIGDLDTNELVYGAEYADNVQINKEVIEKRNFYPNTWEDTVLQYSKEYENFSFYDVRITNGYWIARDEEYLEQSFTGAFWKKR